MNGQNSSFSANPLSNACRQQNITQFSQVIMANGYTPPKRITPGETQTMSGKDNKRTAWCHLLKDCEAGMYGDRATGFWKLWKPNHTPEAEETAEAKAKRMWESSTPCPDHHPYALRQRIKPLSARCYIGEIILPVLDMAAAFQGVIMVRREDGYQFHLPGELPHGYFTPVSVGPKQATHSVIICTDWVTGCTLAEHAPNSHIIAANTTDNVVPVALAVRERMSEAPIIIAADDDRQIPSNPGMTAAQEAAERVGGDIIAPQWPYGAPTHLRTFNDLMVWEPRSEI